MNLTPFVERLRAQLVAAVEVAEQRAVADRLLASLEPAVRLCLLEALSAAADEITREIAPSSVEVRLRGGEPEFVSSQPDMEETAARLDGPLLPPSTPPGDSESPIARINLRLPEDLKERVDETAGSQRLSTNEWLVRLIAEALAAPDRDAFGRHRRGRPGQSYTGWVG